MNARHRSNTRVTGMTRFVPMGVDARPMAIDARCLVSVIVVRFMPFGVASRQSDVILSAAADGAKLSTDDNVNDSNNYN